MLNNNNHKTPTMRLIELQRGEPIEVLITSGSLRKVARDLGVSHITIRNWLRRLHISLGSIPNNS